MYHRCCSIRITACCRAYSSHSKIVGVRQYNLGITAEEVFGCTDCTNAKFIPSRLRSISKPVSENCYNPQRTIFCSVADVMTFPEEKYCAPTTLFEKLLKYRRFPRTRKYNFQVKISCTASSRILTDAIKV